MIIMSVFYYYDKNIYNVRNNILLTYCLFYLIN